MLIKSFFDGSNKPDPDRYTNLTLASLSGMLHEWRPFESLWSRTLAKHGASYLHTTDAVSLQNQFSRQNGWDRGRISGLLLDCAKVLRSKCATQVGAHIPRLGLRPCAIRIELADYLLAQESIGNAMPVLTDIMAQQAIGYCGAWSQFRGGHFLEAIFDNKGPYRGHILDRLRSPGAKPNFPLSNSLTCKEASMKETPAIQACALVAWSVGHREQVKNEWHRMVLDLPRDGDHFDCRRLLKMNPAALFEIDCYKLPPRARMRRKATSCIAAAS
jgi:hypothetical protein